MAKRRERKRRERRDMKRIKIGDIEVRTGKGEGREGRRLGNGGAERKG